ncbi:hypothetical protein SEA_SCENTAE_213 [Gordonia phage SCentae]|nr:hypothetical protein SEA_SCENTAE_213 [Gordonia phage SCentae]
MKARWEKIEPALWMASQLFIWTGIPVVMLILLWQAS